MTGCTATSCVDSGAEATEATGTGRPQMLENKLGPHSGAAPIRALQRRTRLCLGLRSLTEESVLRDFSRVGVVQVPDAGTASR
jgi:hypothetical protein